MDSNVTDYVDSRPDRLNLKSEAHSSGVSWGAVIGGAFVAAAFYLILLALGAGFGGKRFVLETRHEGSSEGSLE